MQQASTNTVNAVTRLGSGQSGVQFLAGTEDFSPLQDIQPSSEAHIAFYSVCTRGPFSMS
jgi:hypothetical protein